MRPELMNALAVAYLGDAVFEVYVREYLLTEKGIMKPHEYKELLLNMSVLMPMQAL